MGTDFSAEPRTTGRPEAYPTETESAGGSMDLPALHSRGRHGATCPVLRRRLVESLGHEIPVHDVVEGVHVLHAPVLVFEIIGVLPKIDAEQREMPFGEGTVLVGRRFDHHVLAIQA